MPPAAAPNWLLPISLPGFTANFNSALRNELFVPLYVFNNSSGTLALDDAASAADPPRYAPDGRSVTITLKNLTWSTGVPLTSRDVSYVSFLGLGVPAPTTDWGAMLSKGLTYTYDGAWWLILPPGIAIVVVVCAVNYVGDGLRAAFAGRGLR